MIYGILYLMVGITIAFFMTKKAMREPPRYSSHESSLEDPDTIILIFFASAFWPAAIPSIGFWKLLDYLYNKFNQPTKEQ